MAENVAGVINFVEDCSSSGTITAENYLNAIQVFAPLKVFFSFACSSCIPFESFEVFHYHIPTSSIVINSKQLIPLTVSCAANTCSVVCTAQRMDQFQVTLNLIPEDIVLKIVSSLQAADVCALGSCSRFWRQVCGSDCIWFVLYSCRWPDPVLLFDDSSSVPSSSDLIQRWKGMYAVQHYEMAGRAEDVVNFVEDCSSDESVESGNYLKAIQKLCSTKVQFQDVLMFLFKPNHNVLLNLVAMHYSISWLCVPAEDVIEALRSCKILDRQVCIRWWKLGRRFGGFRSRDESHCSWLSLGDLAGAKEKEVLGVLRRGAVHEVLRVQVSGANPVIVPWSC